MLKVNPHYKLDSPSNGGNKIDARLIGTGTGLFIDITTLCRNVMAQVSGKNGAAAAKDSDQYGSYDIFPLRGTHFEGLPVRVLFAYFD